LNSTTLKRPVNNNLALGALGDLAKCKIGWDPQTRLVWVASKSQLHPGARPELSFAEIAGLNESDLGIEVAPVKSGARRGAASVYSSDFDVRTL
jgi:hypothetical protein